MQTIARERAELIRQQEEVLRTSTDERRRNTAREILDLLSGRVTAQTLFAKDEQALLEMAARWERLRSEYDFDKDGYILCKRCGYKRWLHKDYGNALCHCPGCRGEYAKIYDDAGCCPNEIPLKERGWAIGVALALLVYLGYGLFAGVFPIPLRKHVIEFHEWALVPAALSILMLVLYLLSYVADHYDKRNNEYRYPLLRERMFYGVIVSVVTAFVIESCQMAG